MIRGSAAVINGERVEGSTKGGLERVVSIDAGTVQVLREHHTRQSAERLAAGPDWVDRDYVFTTSLGEPVYPDTVSQLMQKLIRAYNASLPDGEDGCEPLPLARLHDLRHIHATTLLLAGTPVHVVAHRLGHADPSITLRVYAHVIREHAADVPDLFAQIVGGVGESSPGAAVSKGVSNQAAGWS